MDSIESILRVLFLSQQTNPCNEIVYREGKIQFDTLTLREKYTLQEKNDEEDPEKSKKMNLELENHL